MKKLLFSIVLALFVSVSTFATDPATFMLDDFENGQVNFTTSVNNNPAASFTYTVVNNPVTTGINTSSKVWEWDRNDFGTDNQIWAGFYATLTTPIPTGYTSIEIKYMRTNATSQLRMKVEGAITKEFNPVSPATKTNEWETLVFDLYGNGIKNINVLSLFPDYYSPVDGAAKCYIDDIKVIYDPSVIVPPPTSIVFLDDVTDGDGTYHDGSWVNPTAPSTVLQPAANLGKFPVVTSPVESGTNALELDWKSVPTGDWVAMVGENSWGASDVSALSQFHFWVNSPTTIAKAAMPLLHFEAAAGSPNETGSVSIAGYMTADLPANTWTEITIPLADIWAANTAFTAKDVIHGVFFTQNATDNVEHTMYLDNFVFDNVAPAPTSIVFLDDVTDGDGTYHDGSYIGVTSPSTVLQPPANPNKFPVVTSPVESGTNALELDWKSVPTGDWVAMVGENSWGASDVSALSQFHFWVNSPTTIAKAAMPLLHFEAAAGSPNETGSVSIAGYMTADLPANTWTEITIPLADIWAANTAFTAKDVIHGVFFTQNATDNVEHTMYLDNFTFDDTATGLFNPKVANNLPAYYANGEITIPNYVGNVSVFDLTGKILAEGLINNGKLRVSIEKGIYIVNTNLGNAKVAVK